MKGLKGWMCASVCALVCLINIWGGSIHATTYVSNGSGNWNNTATWSPAGVPGANDDVTIQNSDLVTLTENEACKNITIAGTSELKLNSYTLDVSGIFTNNATFTAGTG